MRGPPEFDGAPIFGRGGARSDILFVRGVRDIFAVYQVNITYAKGVLSALLLKRW